MPARVGPWKTSPSISTRSRTRQRAPMGLARQLLGFNLLISTNINAMPHGGIEPLNPLPIKLRPERKNDSMKLYTYLNYGGNCQQAFRFYEEHLGGKITMMMTHGQQPNPSAEVPPDWKNAILHARMNLGDTELMGADIPPERFQPMRSAYLTLILSSIDEAERAYVL